MKHSAFLLPVLSLFAENAFHFLLSSLLSVDYVWHYLELRELCLCSKTEEEGFCATDKFHIPMCVRRISGFQLSKCIGDLCIA